MRTFDLTGLALSSLKSHFLRSVLTALGIIFGAASVIAMVSIAEGGKQETLAQIEALGLHSILLETKEMEEKEEKLGEKKKERIKRYGITDGDVARLAVTLENLASVTPVTRFEYFIYARGLKLDVALFGVEPAFIDMANLEITNGRGLSAMDQSTGNQVCILGEEAARKIFRYEPPIGKKVWMGNFGHRVVGIFRNPSGASVFGGINPENTVFIPRATGIDQWSTIAMHTSTGDWDPRKVDVHYLIIRVKELDALSNTAERIRRYMELAHKGNDYKIKVPLELLRQSEATQKTFTIVMSSIAAISLLIGGIGIMNIMLANVYERKKEIGIRRALGAKKGDVLKLFLLETTLISVMGGLMGIPVSYGITKVITLMVDWPVITPTWVIGLAVGISAGIGIIFGTYPAWQAANISPI
ncbi:ABC transporter permease, partial [Planctomycetota bacterium]